MFKVRMQGQYGAETDKRLRAVVSEMWKDWGFRKGIMRGYWVSCVMVKLNLFYLIRLISDR
jgi:solute carrier family 25 carnitine/acylcarnitine transporter 20/29